MRGEMPGNYSTGFSEDGLNLTQALEQWREPSFWHDYIQTARANPGRGDYNIVRPLRHAEAVAWKKVLSHFKDRFFRSVLVAYGRKGSYEGAHTEILPAAWRGASLNFKKGTVTTDDGITYYDVRITKKSDTDALTTRDGSQETLSKSKEDINSSIGGAADEAFSKIAKRQRQISNAAKAIKELVPERWASATNQVKADLVRANLKVSPRTRGYSDYTIIRVLEKAARRPTWSANPQNGQNKQNRLRDLR